LKWKSHRECTKVIAKDMGLDRDHFNSILEGCVYPDKVGFKNEGLMGVPISFPHHKETNQRIYQILVNMRKRVLKGDGVGAFEIGCLAHLIQDRVTFPHAHPNFDDFQNGVAKCRIKSEWREEDVPVLDARVLDELDNILTLNNPDDPEKALKEGYQETLLVLKSVLQDSNLPDEYRPAYKDCKSKFKSLKKSRIFYWVSTYINPLAPLYAILDSKAIANSDMVKRYAYVKKNVIWKGIVSVFAFLIAQDMFWSLLYGLPLLGQALTLRFKIPEDLKRNLEWYNFDDEK
jgi:hypothetical protein